MDIVHGHDEMLQEEVILTQLLATGLRRKVNKGFLLPLRASRDALFASKECEQFLRLEAPNKLLNMRTNELEILIISVKSM